MVFLDLKKKAWIIKDLKIPVIEDVSMKEMKWFKEKAVWIADRETNQDITQSEALRVDEEWWEKTCQIGFNMSMNDVLDSGISEPDFRELMQEVYHFLSVCGTIGRAKLSVLYDPEILKRDPKLLKTTQN
jgi:hypothetical protein